MDWQKRAQHWVEAEAAIEQTSQSVINELMVRARLGSGQHVLDIGCGPGKTVLLAAQQVGPSGRVTGVDIAATMAARARERSAGSGNIEILEANAQNHAFPDQAYDVAISSFGVMFFDNPDVAFVNILHAMRPAGRLCFVAWADKRHNPWFTGPHRALEKAIPYLPSTPPGAPGPLAFADSGKIKKRLRIAGWEQVECNEVGLHLTPPGTPKEVARLRYFMSQFETVEEHARDAEEADTMAQICQSEFATELQEYLTPSGIQVPARVNFFTAQRPA